MEQDWKTVVKESVNSWSSTTERKCFVYSEITYGAVLYGTGFDWCACGVLCSVEVLDNEFLSDTVVS